LLVDTDAGDACLRGYAVADCEHGNASCTQVATGTRQLGARCDESWECVGPGAACLGDGCSRTCQRAGGDGEPCINGLFCSDGNACEGRVCRARVPRGSSCADGAPCGGRDVCTDGTCQAPVNRACFLILGSSSDSNCDPGSRCVSGICTVNLQVGAACYGFDCDDGLACVEGRCAAAPIGAPCVDAAMAYGRSCDPVWRTWQLTTEFSLNAPCTPVGWCAAGSTCRGTTLNPDGGVGIAGTCLATRTGETCVSDFACASGEFCRGERCSLPLAAGEVCDPAASQCAPRLVCADVDDEPTVFRCREYGGAGTSCRTGQAGPCRYPFACADGRCVHGGGPGEPCVGGACLTGACYGADGGVVLDGTFDSVLWFGASASRGVCGPALDDGATCTSAAMCKSGVCHRLRCVALCR
jgi:hypothetical protein